MSRFALRPRSRPHTCTAFAALSALAAAAWLAAPAVASAAQPAANGLQTNVYYDPRDLSSERGTRALYQRLVEAARQVCPGYDSIDDDLIRASQMCQRGAIARAIGQIGNARLAAIDADAVRAGRRG